MDYEKLGVFYLGREVDPESGEIEAAPLLYDSRDLTTHALCVGMTGSGKTGLCIGLLEEAALDGVPALIVDPKGDLGNLLLTFPDLDGESFLPWIDPDAARRKELSPEAFAASQAELWKRGLEDWDQSSDRIRRLREAADFAIYTPGSSAGLGLSILSSFAAPPDSIRRDGDLLRERVTTTATSVLSLLGVDADPVQSREHILFSNLLENAWKAGRNLEIADLVREIQNPPFTRIGVFELESFYPAEKRMDLALKLNNLLASPSFSGWLEGEPMDIDRLLFTSEGKPRISIVSIAHLSDAERMFFVSLLLTQLLGWVRTQSGTSSLRAIFYMDEIFGYFPPVANPPSKAPLLTLLKQARAFGLGLVLATQNPVDLDYKGLSNIGTWFLGRLQTERDKARILDGLESASGSHQKGFSRAELERTISGLGKRIFLLHNVHDEGPELFHTRWVMSYLRGPLTREQIRRLMADRRRLEAPDMQVAVGAASPVKATASQARPILPKSVNERFVPVRTRQPEEAELLYRPALLAAGNIYIASARYDVATREPLSFSIPFESDQPDWPERQALPIDLDELETFPEVEDAAFASLPPTAAKAASYRSWGAAYRSWIYQEKRLDLQRSPALKLVSEPGEADRDFKIRLRQAIREKKDLEKAKLRKKFDTKFRSLEEKARKAEQRIDREQGQANQQKLQTAISFGASLLGAVLGGRRSAGRATTAFRGIGRSFKESGDVHRAEEDLEAAREEREALQATFEREAESLAVGLDALVDEIETVQIRPKKTDINIDTVALLWTPWWRHESGELEKA